MGDVSFMIRGFEESDREQVIELWKSCGLVVPWNDPDKDIDRKLKTGAHLFLVAVEGERVKGSVMGGYDGHRGWINYLAVLPECRRRGVARAMMEEVEKRIADMGCAKINLQVRSANKDVIGFYKKIGYAEEDLLDMGKRLVDDQ
jgi:ribosomal protein S18 acetylase RimI-like enzyme